MIWGCRECTSCEYRYFSSEHAQDHSDENGSSFHTSVKNAFAKLHQGHGTKADIFGTWLQLVKKFTTLNITRELDKLQAISGLACCLSRKLGNPYKWGLSKDDLAQGLL